VYHEELKALNQQRSEYGEHCSALEITTQKGNDKEEKIQVDKLINVLCTAHLKGKRKAI
jgi:hypothetical protein